ncbi:MAG: GH92 family glycosyl hydrolase [Cyclobacteriaceae bacterium]|nr:GH92 family glycosyl hydrolase [Cyclobacteriaceae bacterium HetDA_MAG_MS6]
MFQQKHAAPLLLWSVVLFSCIGENNADRFTSSDPLSYVNPMIGTGAHGHTFPGATTPFGMVQLSPDTYNEGWDWCSGYHYSDSSIMGFSHTHLSGTGRGDLLDILVMPMTGSLRTIPGSRENPDEGYRSRFSHDQEKSSPGYYSVILEDYDIQVELTATPRVGFHRYTLPAEDVYLILDPVHGRVGDQVKGTSVQIVNDTLITGYRKSRGWGEGDEKYWANQQIYFAASFSRPFDGSGVVDSEQTLNGAKMAEGLSTKAYAKFSGDKSRQLLIKVGISAVDINGAINNLRHETPTWDFDQVKEKAANAWRKELEKIEVKSTERANLETFYTALYHTMIAPYLFEDSDGRYRGSDGQIQKTEGFQNYTVFSLWDTFRATHPLYTLTQSQRVDDMIQSMIAQYEEYGLLPVWSLHGSETNCMIGYHSVPVITDAFFKGIGDFDIEKAYEAMKTSAMQDDFGISYLKTYNYIPTDLHNKSVSKTLEYAYDDWCIAQVAKKLGKLDDYAYFIKRAEAYRNVFDSTDRFMKGRNADGSFVTSFDPTFASYGKSDFIEGNSWQYSWFVPHDIRGLIQLMGGKKPFEQQLDRLFSEKQILDENAPIDITGLIGQYAHGNEPSHHVAYLYNFAGVPWKTQSMVNQIMTTLYDNTPEGLSGNEDCGQMSAWYVFSALGMYPVNPADRNYVFGKPHFEESTIRLPNGNDFTIKAEKLSSDNIYIQDIKLNGQPYGKLYITHTQIMAGGELTFVMGPKPSASLANYVLPSSMTTP